MSNDELIFCLFIILFILPKNYINYTSDPHNLHYINITTIRVKLWMQCEWNPSIWVQGGSYFHFFKREKKKLEIDRFGSLFIYRSSISYKLAFETQVYLILTGLLKVMIPVNLIQKLFFRKITCKIWKRKLMLYHSIKIRSVIRNKNVY